MGIRGGIITRGEAKRSSISAVVTRADGTIENYGVVAYYNRNPILNFFGNVAVKFKRYVRRH